MYRMKQVVLILLVIAACVVTCIDGCLDFNATPPVVILGSTKDFSLTCNYKYTESSAIKNVTSMAIAKVTTPGQPKNLAFIDKETGGKYNVRTYGNVRIYGEFDKDNKTSSLALHFREPVLQRDEVYACIVKGRSETGGALQLVERENVTVKNDHLQPLVIDKLFYPPVAYKDAVYYLSREKAASYAMAAGYCSRLGGYLIEVDDEGELAMAEKLSRHYETRFVFIAGSDEEVEGHWIFPRTGQNVTYFNWDVDSPDDHNREDCRIIQYFHRGNRINDVKCIWNINFMCEVKNVRF